MIPTYMKEDLKFYSFYQYISSIFEQIKDTCKNMINYMQFDINSAEFLKVLSLFGQSEVFKKEGIEIQGLEYDKDSKVWNTKPTESQVMIDITLSQFSLYFSSKFKTLKNNFDGTFKNLKDNLVRAFDLSTDGIAVISTEDDPGVYQSTITDTNDIEHPYINVSITISPLLVDKFPPLEAYQEGKQPWYIQNIDPAWIAESDENRTKYNTYKDYLELLTLFYNNYFDFNILGVITEYEISGNVPMMRWNRSRWNEAIWSNDVVQEEE